MKIEYTAMYTKDGKLWAAQAVEFPGAHAQGDTIEHARRNLADAVRDLVKARRQIAANHREQVVAQVEFEYQSVEV